MMLTNSSNVVWGRIGLVAVIAASLCCAGCNDADAGYSIERRSLTGGSTDTLGIDSQELVEMTQKMVRDILSNPKFMNRKAAPKIIVDSEYFSNESSERFNVNMLTGRLRTELVIAANGRLQFVSRESLGMKTSEDDMRAYSGSSEEGVASTADYRLRGRITSLTGANYHRGTQSKTHQIVFELIDTKTTNIVWANLYDFKKAGKMDGAYR